MEKMLQIQFDSQDNREYEAKESLSSLDHVRWSLRYEKMSLYQ